MPKIRKLPRQIPGEDGIVVWFDIIVKYTLKDSKFELAIPKWMRTANDGQYLLRHDNEATLMKMFTGLCNDYVSAVAKKRKVILFKWSAETKQHGLRQDFVTKPSSSTPGKQLTFRFVIAMEHKLTREVSGQTLITYYDINDPAQEISTFTYSGNEWTIIKWDQHTEDFFKAMDTAFDQLIAKFANFFDAKNNWLKIVKAGGKNLLTMFSEG